MVVHFCNQYLGSLRQEDHEFQANLGCIARPSLSKRKKKKKPKQIKKKQNLTVMAQAYNPSILEAEAGG
jgi:hypothetical protein